MQLPPLAQETKLEFAVNRRGEAMLLHEGALPHAYAWAQYDSLADSIQFVTEEGGLQELGFALPQAIRDILSKTQQLTMLRINDDRACAESILVVFNNVLH